MEDGGAWESNPPTQLFAGYNGFEIRGLHQDSRHLQGGASTLTSWL
jgi:hypothetical protein